MKKNLASLLTHFLPVVIVIFLIKMYAPWFLSPLTSAGDWPYFSHKMMQDWSVLAPFWTRQGGIGLGGVNPDFPIFSYQYFTVGFFTNLLHIPWSVVYKITWFGLFIFLSFISSIFLYKVIKPKAEIWEKFLAAFLYLANSYILMVVGGGQMGIALAYSVTPLVVGVLIIAQQALERNSIKHIVRSGLLVGIIYSLQIFFEPRTSYITGIIMILYSAYQIFLFKKIQLQKQIIFWGVAIVCVFLIHSYWVVPFFLFHLLSVPKGITSSAGFTFFSFADFSHAFSLLQPNWPENIFGKVSFLHPEFIIYPIFAFSGLLFEKMRKNTLFMFFALVVLLFTFLAKGTTEPFGFINVWIFTHIPGMNVFRDPTKFYYFISLGYLVMIPYSISSFVQIKLFGTSWGKMLFLFLALLLLAFPIRDAILGKLTGTFTTTKVPNEYIQLEDFISSQPKFFRTLWIPDQSRFRFISETHPMMVAQTFFNTASESAIECQLASFATEKKLQEYSIKYVIIPDDTLGEIFLSDRKYDDKKRKDLIEKLNSVPYLKKQTIGNIILYENPMVNDYLFITNGSISPKKTGDSQYALQIDAPKPAKLYFGEAYNTNWFIRLQGKYIESSQTKEGLNSFDLPSGKYQAFLTFYPDELKNYFYFFSATSLIIIVICLILLR